MRQRFDTVTVALTGQLTLILIVSAVLALLASSLFLFFYRRAVIKSMRRRSRSEILEPTGFLPPEPEHRPNDAPLHFSYVTRNAALLNRDAAALYRRANRRQRLVAFVHIIAGCCFAATMTAAFLVASKLLEFLPFRFMFFTWAHAWPVLIAIDLSVGLSHRGKLFSALVYFLIGSVIGAILLAKSPGLPVGQLLYIWLDINVIPTVLLLIFLNRRIRAVGPLVLIFMVLGVTGAIFAVTLTGNNQKLLRAVSDFGSSVGLGRSSTMVFPAIGFLAFGIIAWLILAWLRRLYVKKYVSEQSINIDAMWLLFGIVNSIGLVFQGRWWIFSGLAAFAVYKVVAAGLFRGLGIARRAKSRGYRLLLLRVFALGKRSETLYDTLGKSWRGVGSIQLIAGPDLATSTVEPHEFLDFLGGKLSRRFIDTGRTLDLCIDRMDLAPDGDGQFRVSEFFCHDDTWKITLARLADESDAVLMDLRGFGRPHGGCIFEINELFNLVQLQRIVFAMDNTTDQAFMRGTMQEAWNKLKDRSPNHRLPAGTVSLVQLPRDDDTRDLLYALCAAASANPGVKNLWNCVQA